MALSATRAKALNEPGRYSDGESLHRAARQTGGFRAGAEPASADCVPRVTARVPRMAASRSCCAKRTQTPPYPHLRVPTSQPFFITLLG